MGLCVVVLYLPKVGCLTVLGLLGFESFLRLLPKTRNDAFGGAVVDVEDFCGLSKRGGTFFMEQLALMMSSRNCALTRCVILLYFFWWELEETAVSMESLESTFLILFTLSMISFIAKTLRLITLGAVFDYINGL